jgi:hypothetical protein
MTQLLAFTSKTSVWLAADRRLTFERGLRDDAFKVFRLDTDDARCLIAYSGIGRTAGSTEISEWLPLITRGRRLTLLNALSDIAAIADHHLRPHLGQRIPFHIFLIMAVEEHSISVYRIEINLNFPKPLIHRVLPNSESLLPPRFVFTGSGGAYIRVHERHQVRSIWRLLKQLDQGQPAASCIARHIGSMMTRISSNCSGVSPSCIVSAITRNSFSGHYYLEKDTIQTNTPMMPTVSHGMDISQLARSLQKAMAAGEIDAITGIVDEAKLKARTHRLDNAPRFPLK